MDCFAQTSQTRRILVSGREIARSAASGFLSSEMKKGHCRLPPSSCSLSEADDNGRSRVVAAHNRAAANLSIKFSMLKICKMVRAEGFEPPRLSPLEPKSSASTSSATPAFADEIASSRFRFSDQPRQACGTATAQRGARVILKSPVENNA